MNRIFSAGAALALATFFMAGQGIADDRPLIWKPSKTSDTSYSVKLGLKLPTRIEAEAGVSMGMNTTKSGAPVDTPVRFLEQFHGREDPDAGLSGKPRCRRQARRHSGGAAITMNYYEKEIATPTVDIERRSSYGMRYDGVSGQWCGMDASQSVRLSHGPTGTALIGRATGSNGFRTVGAGLGIEKKIGRYMTVSGSVDRMSDSPAPIANVNARYSFTW